MNKKLGMAKVKRLEKLEKIQQKIAAKGTVVLLVGIGTFILGIIVSFCSLLIYPDVEEATVLIGLTVGASMSLIGIAIMIMMVVMLCIERYKEHKNKEIKEKPTEERPRDRLLEPLMGIITGSFLILTGLLLFHPEVAEGYQIGGEVDLAFEISFYIFTGIMGIIGGIVVRKYRKVGAPLLLFNGFLFMFYFYPFHLFGLIFCLAGIFALIRKPWSREEVERIKSKLR